MNRCILLMSESVEMSTMVSTTLIVTDFLYPYVSNRYPPRNLEAPFTSEPTLEINVKNESLLYISIPYYLKQNIMYETGNPANILKKYKIQNSFVFRKPLDFFRIFSVVG